MALTLSGKCLDIQPSVTLAIDARAKQLRQMGLDVIGFGAGEPDFDTPEYIRDAAKDALDQGMTRYTPVAGTLELRDEICVKLWRDNGLEYQPGEILVSNGAKQCLFNALSAVLDPGDEVIIPAPCWVSYPEMVRVAGGVPVMAMGDPDRGFIADADILRAYVTDKTKAIIINSPNNPNGYVYTKEMLQGIADLAIEKQLYVISDEVYEKLVYDDAEHVSIASLNDKIREQTIVINGVSKSYAMTGWRIGYAAAPIEIIKVMSAFQSHTTSGANAIAQHAAAIALTNGEKFMHDSHEEFDERRQLICKLINERTGLSAYKPKGAFYIMMDISNVIGKQINGKVIEGSESFAQILLDNKQVAVVPAKAFGADRYVRLSYATSKDKIVKGMKRISEFVKELQ